MTEGANSEAIGARMRAERERAGYTVNALARVLGVKPAAVQAWEISGEKMPLPIFWNFCQYFDASPDDILYGSDHPGPSSE